MKVYISFDIEGVSGIADLIDIQPGSKEFEQAMVLSTRDVNAAVEGALEAGATEIVVNDGHGWARRDILYENLHPEAKLLRGKITSPMLNMAGFDGTYNAVFFVGWHGRASSAGILSHTLNSRAFLDWRMNGVPVGEPELAAAVAGQYGVPVVLFTGDDQSCAEVKAWNPEIETVEVKQALDRHTALVLSKEKTYDLIKTGANKAITKRKSVKPFNFKPPFKIEVECLNDYFANSLALIPGTKVHNSRVVTFESNDYLEMYRCFHAFTCLSVLAVQNIQK